MSAWDPYLATIVPGIVPGGIILAADGVLASNIPLLDGEAAVLTSLCQGDAAVDAALAAGIKINGSKYQIVGLRTPFGVGDQFTLMSSAGAFVGVKTNKTIVLAYVTDKAQAQAAAKGAHELAASLTKVNY